MTFCAYDNPENNRREFWADGYLVISNQIDTQRPASAHSHALRYDHAWQPGQLVGDVRAIAKGARPCA